MASKESFPNQATLSLSIKFDATKQHLLLSKTFFQCHIFLPPKTDLLLVLSKSKTNMYIQPWTNAYRRFPFFNVKRPYARGRSRG